MVGVLFSELFGRDVKLPSWNKFEFFRSKWGWLESDLILARLESSTPNPPNPPLSHYPKGLFRHFLWFLKNFLGLVFLFSVGSVDHIINEDRGKEERGGLYCVRIWMLTVFICIFFQLRIERNLWVHFFTVSLWNFGWFQIWFIPILRRNFGDVINRVIGKSFE